MDIPNFSFSLGAYQRLVRKRFRHNAQGQYYRPHMGERLHRLETGAG